MIPLNYGQITDIIPFNNTIYVFILGGEYGQNQLWEISGTNFEKKRILVEYLKFHTIMHDSNSGNTQYWVITDLNNLKWTSRVLPGGIDISCIF